MIGQDRRRFLTAEDGFPTAEDAENAEVVLSGSDLSRTGGLAWDRDHVGVARGQRHDAGGTCSKRRTKLGMANRVGPWHPTLLDAAYGSGLE